MKKIERLIEKHNQTGLEGVWGCDASMAKLHGDKVIVASHFGSDGEFDIEILTIDEFITKCKEIT